MADKGGAELLALLPKGLGKGDMPEGEGGDDEAGEDAGTTAARDFYQAGEKGDWAAASEALETFVLNCQSKYKSDET